MLPTTQQSEAVGHDTPVAWPSGLGYCCWITQLDFAFATAGREGASVVATPRAATDSEATR